MTEWPENPTIHPSIHPSSIHSFKLSALCTFTRGLPFLGRTLHYLLLPYPALRTLRRMLLVPTLYRVHRKEQGTLTNAHSFFWSHQPNLQRLTDLPQRKFHRTIISPPPKKPAFLHTQPHLLPISTIRSFT